MREGAWCLRDESSRHGITLVSSPGIAPSSRYTEVIGLAPGQTFRFGHTDVVFQRIRPPGELVEPFCGMVGTSPALLELTREIERIARRARRVAVCGATGTGKELVARVIHKCSGRPGAFIALNCGAIPGERVESELFGHLAGSVIGAIADRPGAFRAAHQGTLFLDEIGDLPMQFQLKLLRVLQEQTVKPVGEDTEYPVDVQVVCGGQETLEEMAARKALREDLCGQLEVFPLRVPSLAERVEDIVPLILHFTAELDTPYVFLNPSGSRERAS